MSGSQVRQAWGERTSLPVEVDSSPERNDQTRNNAKTPQTFSHRTSGYDGTPQDPIVFDSDSDDDLVPNVGSRDQRQPQKRSIGALSQSATRIDSHRLTYRLSSSPANHTDTHGAPNRAFEDESSRDLTKLPRQYSNGVETYTKQHKSATDRRAISNSPSNGLNGERSNAEWSNPAATQKTPRDAEDAWPKQKNYVDIPNTRAKLPVQEHASDVNAPSNSFSGSHKTMQAHSESNSPVRSPITAISRPLAASPRIADVQPQMRPSRQIITQPIDRDNSPVVSGLHTQDRSGSYKVSSQSPSPYPATDGLMAPPKQTHFRRQNHKLLDPAKVISDAVARYHSSITEEDKNRNATWLREARTSISKSSNQSTDDKPTNVFSKMQPLVPKRAERSDTDTTAAFRSAALGNKVPKVFLSVPCNIYNTDDIKDISSYSHFVSISQSILAHNEVVLSHWPFSGDEESGWESKLRRQHYFDMTHRERKITRLVQAEHIGERIDEIMDESGCNWSDLLHFLLSPRPDVGANPAALQALRHRESFCREDFKRDHERWRTVLAQLPQANPDDVGRAAILCEHFQETFQFPLWHMVRRSDYVTKLLVRPKPALATQDLLCRVCFRFTCPFHGEIQEDGQGLESPTSDDNKDYVVETDVFQPFDVNSSQRVSFPSRDAADDDQHTRRRPPQYWKSKKFVSKIDRRGPFYPCHHPGLTCETAECSCFRERIPCEKTCGCSLSCQRRFSGCRCSNNVESGNKTQFVCYRDDRCVCYQLERECDPDLCGPCGAADMLSAHRRDRTNNFRHVYCDNVSLQIGVPKHTVLGESQIHGLGLYACEDVKQHEFVGEYKGEIITKDESERRGAVYEIQKLTYLFSLNKTQEIDSTYLGNKIRFINHASQNYNLYPRIVMVNAVHRIGLYAKRNIRPGEELLFNYGPKFHQEMLGGKKKRARRSGVDDDEEDEDEDMQMDDSAGDATSVDEEQELAQRRDFDADLQMPDVPATARSDDDDDQYGESDSGDGPQDAAAMRRRTAKKSMPHVHNPRLTRSFYDVEVSEDEVGRVQAKKSVSKRGKSFSRGGRGGRGGSQAASKKPVEPPKKRGRPRKIVPAPMEAKQHDDEPTKKKTDRPNTWTVGSMLSGWYRGRESHSQGSEVAPQRRAQHEKTLADEDRQRSRVRKTVTRRVPDDEDDDDADYSNQSDDEDGSDSEESEEMDDDDEDMDDAPVVRRSRGVYRQR